MCIYIYVYIYMCIYMMCIYIYMMCIYIYVHMYMYIDLSLWQPVTRRLCFVGFCGMFTVVIFPATIWISAVHFHQLLMDCRYIPTSRSCSSWPSYIVCIHYVYYACKKGARKTAPRRRTILPTSLIECVIVCSYVFLILPLLSAEICSWGR